MSLKDDINTDLGNMLSSDDFGYQVTYSRATDGACEGISDYDFLSVDMGEVSPPIEDQKPTLLIRRSDLDTDPQHKDALTVVDVGDFIVTGIQPDGTGAILLILEDA